MKKSVFVRKYHGTGYEKNMVYMEYEYRGYTYTVYENRAKGNEPLSWQHASEQGRIDEIIRQKNLPKNENAESWEVGFNKLMDYFEQE